LQRQAGDYGRGAPKQAKTHSNCKTRLVLGSPSAVSRVNTRKSQSEFLNFKAAREKASNRSFWNHETTTEEETDRLILDRDFMTRKKAPDNKIPVGEKKLTVALNNRGIRKEEHPAIATSPGRDASGSETPIHDVMKFTSSLRLDFSL